MAVGIYGIFDSETDECLYVGLSKNIEERWRSHMKNLRSGRHKRKDFVEWFHDNGAVEELLSFRILEECNHDETILNILEIKWFNDLKPKFYGKQPSLNEKWEHSVETKEKIQQAASVRRVEPVKILCANCQKTFLSEKWRKPQLKCCSPQCAGNLRKRVFSPTKELLYELYWRKGLSAREIGEIYHVSRTTVNDRMKKLGVPKRQIGRAIQQ